MIILLQHNSIDQLQMYSKRFFDWGQNSDLEKTETVSGVKQIVRNQIERDWECLKLFTNEISLQIKSLLKRRKIERKRSPDF